MVYNKHNNNIKVNKGTVLLYNNCRACHNGCIRFEFNDKTKNDSEQRR